MYARNMPAQFSDAKLTWLLIAIVTGADSCCGFVCGGATPARRCLSAQLCLFLPNHVDIAATVDALARRVRSAGGKAQVIKTIFVDESDAARIIAEQTADRDREYQEVVERTGEFLAEIDRETERHRATYTAVEESEADLERFDRWLKSIVARDYFQAPGRQEAEAAIHRCRTALASF